ncbi:LacI family DNA-binding transcriptional regulator [Kineococcus glutinatus]|uniref:LacI family DNA-binding transcriptional regulator n=1 Tax=Kineococcus glutinatus TaxID=1070872 RepID=A0ABP9HQK7_9ACTN
MTATTHPAAGDGRPTLRQVAELAGVSIKTASRALNGDAHVRDVTSTRVHAAADQLGFRLNGLARELRRGGRAASVGLVIGDLANPFYSRIARGAEQVLRGHGLQLVTCSTNEDAATERALTASLVQQRVRALLVVPTTEDSAHLADEQRHGMPVVCLDRRPVGAEIDSIVLDNRRGAVAAAEHLLRAGHRRIGLVGDFSRLSTHRERVAGFGEALRAAGIAEWQRHVRGDSHDEASAELITHQLLSLREPPTALFTTNNRNTVGALRALRSLGPAAPRPALVGFDDFALADVLGITVVAHEPEDMGRLGADLALARAEGTGPDGVRSLVLPTRLVARGSGEVPPP